MTSMQKGRGVRAIPQLEDKLSMMSKNPTHFADVIYGWSIAYLKWKLALIFRGAQSDWQFSSSALRHSHPPLQPFRPSIHSITAILYKMFGADMFSVRPFNLGLCPQPSNIVPHL